MYRDGGGSSGPSRASLGETKSGRRRSIKFADEVEEDDDPRRLTSVRADMSQRGQPSTLYDEDVDGEGPSDRNERGDGRGVGAIGTAEASVGSEATVLSTRHHSDEVRTVAAVFAAAGEDVEHDTYRTDDDGSAVVRAGYLYKLPSSGRIGSWQRRFVVLTKHALKWYAEAGTGYAEGWHWLTRGRLTYTFTLAFSPSRLHRYSTEADFRAGKKKGEMGLFSHCSVKLIVKEGLLEVCGSRKRLAVRASEGEDLALWCVDVDAQLAWHRRKQQDKYDEEAGEASMRLVTTSTKLPQLVTTSAKETSPDRPAAHEGGELDRERFLRVQQELAGRKAEWSKLRPDCIDHWVSRIVPI